MASTYTANQGIEKMDTGDQSGTWGGTVNTNMDIIDRAISGVGALTLTGSTTTLTTTDGTLTDGMYRVLVLGDGGDLGSDNTITLSPNDQDKAYLVYNNLSANRNAIFSQGTGANATVQNGETAWIYADGAGSGAAVRTAVSSVKITDQDGDTQIQVEEGGDDDDTIRFDIAGAEDFTMTANTFNVLSGSTLDVNSGATITNNGTATGFGADAERAFAGVLQTNSNFVDQCIFGPSVDGMPWSGLWSKASVFSSLMLATLEDEGSNSEINIWDLTEQSSGAPSTTPLATVDLASAATPNDIAACMGYLIVSSEDGIHIIDPHSGSWAERTAGWPRTLTTSTVPSINYAPIGVAAGLTPSSPYDPRTGGPLPVFGVTFVNGAAKETAVLKDGKVWEISGAGSATGHAGTAIVSGGRLLSNYNDEQLRQQSIDLFNANVSVNPPYMFTSNEFASIAAAADVADGSGELTALGSGEGLGLVTFPYVSTFSAGSDQAGIAESMNANITRAYNTGYIVSGGNSPIGVWLANSKTADRGFRNNTLTENGTVTEAAVESGAELNGYTGFSASNNFSRASDSDWDVIGTGSVYMSIWCKTTNASGNSWCMSFGNSGDTISFQFFITGSGAVQARDDGATAQVDMTSPVINDNKWHKIDFVRVSSTERYLYIDGVQTNSSTTDAGSISSSGNLPFYIGVNSTNGSSNPADAETFSLAHLSATPPTATQVRKMYDAEKGMFVASAECLLQSGSTDAVLDVSVDPLTSKVLDTQPDAITIFDVLAIDSKPTVNSGSSEKGKLWGNLRTEQNSANAYVTAPAVDQRQVNEVVRGLANEVPKGVDLSKAKAWLRLDGTGTIDIVASYNIKSVTDVGTGIYEIYYAVPFKSATGYIMLANGPAAVFIVANSLALITESYVRIRSYARAGGADTDADPIFLAFFGELENE